MIISFEELGRPVVGSVSAGTLLVVCAVSSVQQKLVSMTLMKATGKSLQPIQVKHSWQHRGPAVTEVRPKTHRSAHVKLCTCTQTHTHKCTRAELPQVCTCYVRIEILLCPFPLCLINVPQANLSTAPSIPSSFLISLHSPLPIPILFTLCY